MWRLFRPLRYFALQNAEKRRIDLWGTIVVASLILLPFVLTPDAAFFRAGGLLDRLGGLTAALTGFYVAALVAAATFAHPDLDREMAVGAVYRSVVDDEGHSFRQRLTRREFACEIFGYLAFASLGLAVCAGIAVPIATAAPEAPAWAPASAKSWLVAVKPYVRWVGMAATASAVGHILTATGLGIYYLVERIHYQTPRVVTTHRDAA